MQLHERLPFSGCESCFLLLPSSKLIHEFGLEPSFKCLRNPAISVFRSKFGVCAKPGYNNGNVLCVSIQPVQGR